MCIQLSNSKEAIQAYKIVSMIQKHFVENLNTLSLTYSKNLPFEKMTWLRDEGIHGGGNRFQAKDLNLFNTASVNVSQVHYKEDENKNLISASAISSIIHPKNPLLPSLHIHISYTQVKNQTAYWRIMADLNPSNLNENDYETFKDSLKNLSHEYFEEGIKQGDKYFYIPCLKTHRGVSHFYLENHNTSDEKKDFNFAKNFGLGIIDTYIDILKESLHKNLPTSKKEEEKQLNYHTLYLFQVLTLDRGTTSGLLVHTQNNLGIMASLPRYINKKLLDSWIILQKTPQDELLENIVAVISDEGLIDDKTKDKLAFIVREHYTKYPQALNLQASGNTIPKLRIVN